MNETKNMLGRPIYNLQTMLRFLSQTDNRILPVIPDGIYGSNTYASVRSFQEIYDLKPTGTVDLLTWNRIVTGYETERKNNNLPASLYIAQAMLLGLSKTYPAITGPSVTGENNPQTEAGLRVIQAAAGLPQDGFLTAETYRALLSLFSA